MSATEIRHTRGASRAPDFRSPVTNATVQMAEPGSTATPTRRSDDATPPAFAGEIVADRYSFWYGPKQALHEVSLTLRARRVTALIGPSGCGKSTFLRSINRLNALIPGARHEGSIRLDADDIYDSGMDAVQLRQRVGMVFQRWNPFPRSIYDNVAYGPRVNGKLSRAALDEASSSRRCGAPRSGTR